MSERASEKDPGWIDSENLDCQVSEACQLYGIDKLECTRNKATNRNDGDDADSITSEDSGKDNIPLQDRVNSQLYIVRETDSGKTLWRCPLKESDTIADHMAAVNKLSYRLPCHSFRSMLPPLDSCPPIQSQSWLRFYMRGVLFASLHSYSEDRLSSIDPHINRLRFPEFVYCWFAGSEARLADEDRWAFYHGLKLSSDSNPECWLIYNLLDDMQGEDYLTFLTHSMESIKKQMGKSWDHQFGELITCIAAFKSKTELTNAIQKHGSCLDDEQTFTASNVWIPIEKSKEVVYQLFYSDGIKSSEYAEDLSNKVDEMATDIDNYIMAGDQVAASQDESDTVTSSVDLFTFLQMIMTKYLSHRRKQVTLIRLMFETASRGVLTDFYDAQESNHPSYQEGISVPQLYQILKTIWKSITLKETTQIYREAYDVLSAIAMG